MNKFFSKNRGFTLIELLVVIGIIGILAAGVVVLLNPGAQLAKARDTQRKSDLKQIQNALEQYYSDHQFYPSAASTLASTSGSCLNSSSGNSTWWCWYEYKSTFMFNSNSTTMDGTNYIKRMPVDPSLKDLNACTLYSPRSDNPTRSYAYYSSNGQSYLLVTRLENLSDPSIQSGAPNAYDGSGGGCTQFANYKIQVP